MATIPSEEIELQYTLPQTPSTSPRSRDRPKSKQTTTKKSPFRNKSRSPKTNDYLTVQQGDDEDEKDGGIENQNWKSKSGASSSTIVAHAKKKIVDVFVVTIIILCCFSRCFRFMMSHYIVIRKISIH